MDTLELHTLICKRDIEWFEKTYKLFKHHSNIDFNVIIHEDGSFTRDDKKRLVDTYNNFKIIDRAKADEEILQFLKGYELCTHFRLSLHHTIFRIKLFDPFYYTKNHNVLYMDADILFCKKPEYILDCFNTKKGFYIRDTWSSYCVPFRDEDNDTLIVRNINAGLTYFPSIQHYSLDEIENCLQILYNHGSRGATHPFLEQTCIAYMISKLQQKGIVFDQLPYPEYCIPTFGKFIPDHNLTTLHLNSSPLVGQWKSDHYNYELNRNQIMHQGCKST
jgi:hypothetical protein